MENFNEKDCRLFYRFLNHKFLTELRFLKKGEFAIFKIVKNEEDFVKACKVWNGKRNVYAGLRDRKKDLKRPAKAEDIIGIQTIVLDIDPIREIETPSTDKELQRAIEVSKIIQNWFLKKGFFKPYRAMTGNGVCLYFSVPFFEVNDENRLEITQILSNFESKMRKIFKKILEKFNCKIDPMYDLPRIGKVIGTISIKGKETKERPHRVSFWIEKPLERREDQRLLNFILKECRMIE